MRVRPPAIAHARAPASEVKPKARAKRFSFPSGSTASGSAPPVSLITSAPVPPPAATTHSQRRADSPWDRSDALGPLPYDDRFQPPASQCRRQGLDMRGVGPAPAYGLAAIAILRAGLDVMGG
ncbi:MAG: hypothetical protein AUH81_14285 [Candidatus Rokubacteria bacterium 13_1_40CM_4_69_5]|nr:MAG: hypothetical protein AUH81_14285 [Candidatus Rokubacteria bacterium 13_1_40CM_4_69_5]OLE37025.1 MAG: hypothetical protein AUG00_09305 [Candidatus Rokubacteria bacterium 13_1_20CM_2_70_7]